MATTWRYGPEKHHPPIPNPPESYEFSQEKLDRYLEVHARMDAERHGECGDVPRETLHLIEHRGCRPYDQKSAAKIIHPNGTTMETFDRELSSCMMRDALRHYNHRG